MSSEPEDFGGTTEVRKPKKRSDVVAKYKLLAAIGNDRALPKSAVSVAYWMLEYASDDGRMFLGTWSLEQLTGLSTRTVEQAKAALVASRYFDYFSKDKDGKPILGGGRRRGNRHGSRHLGNPSIYVACYERGAQYVTVAREDLQRALDERDQETNTPQPAAEFPTGNTSVPEVAIHRSPTHGYTAAGCGGLLLQ